MKIPTFATPRFKLGDYVTMPHGCGDQVCRDSHLRVDGYVVAIYCYPDLSDPAITRVAYAVARLADDAGEEYPDFAQAIDVACADGTVREDDLQLAEVTR